MLYRVSTGSSAYTSQGITVHVRTVPYFVLVWVPPNNIMLLCQYRNLEISDRKIGSLPALTVMVERSFFTKTYDLKRSRYFKNEKSLVLPYRLWQI